MLFSPETMAVAGRLNTLVIDARAAVIQAPEARLLGLTQGQIVTAIAEVRGERLKLILQGRAIELPRGLRLSPGDAVTLKALPQTSGQWQLQPQAINGKPVTLAPTPQTAQAPQSPPASQTAQTTQTTPAPQTTPAKQIPQGQQSLQPVQSRAGAATPISAPTGALTAIAQTTIAQAGAPTAKVSPKTPVPPGHVRIAPDGQVTAKAADALAAATNKPVATQTPAGVQQPLAQPDAAVSARLSALLSRPPDTSAWAHLFKSGALDQLLKWVTNAAPRSSAATTALATPAGAAAPLAERFDQWPLLNLRMGGLTPRTLRDAMLASGLSAEALLARGDSKGRPDVKTLLRQLMAVLQQGTNAHTVVKDAFDDIERAQVDAAQALERRELAFSLVLPFSDAEPINLKFQRHAKRDDAPGHVYTVDVHTQNQRLGELWMRSQIHIQADRTDVALTMWAVRADVAVQARAHVDDLRDELEAAGLGLIEVQVFNAARPNQDAAWTTPDAGTVLDVSA
jgi:hypothetical protein